MARSVMIRRVGALLLALGFAAPAYATPPRSENALFDTMPVLRPGQYLWDDSAVSDDPVAIMVSIDRQHVYVYRGARLIGVSTASTGKPGHGTPMGAFRILQKNVWHRSNLYSNAPMPYMQRLTWGGIAIHAGALPGVPASHGCIRVPLGFAKKLFAVTDMGGIVSVSDGQTGPSLRIEVDIAALRSDDMPEYGRMVRLAVAQSVPVPVAVPARRSKPVRPVEQPRAEQLAMADPAPRLGLDNGLWSRGDKPAYVAPAPVAAPTVAAAPPAIKATTTPAPDTSRPHWVVPYYDDKRDRSSE